MKYVSFDIETEGKAPESRTDSYKIGVTCIGAYVRDGHATHKRVWHGEEQPDGRIANKMRPVEVQAFIQYLCEMQQDGYTIVAWNGASFDLRVLAEEAANHEWYLNARDLALSHVDPMFQMLCHKGFPVGLDAVARGMGVAGKLEGMDGVKAVEMWATGTRQDQERVLDYVLQDAVTTGQVYEKIIEHGGIAWITRRGKRSYATFTGKMIGDGLQLPSVRECVEQIPLPDTSWMSSPLTRSDLIGWTGYSPDGKDAS